MCRQPAAQSPAQRKGKPMPISIDGHILHGLPRVEGTRIPVWSIARLLMLGESVSEIISVFPELTKDDVVAARTFVVSALQNAELWTDYQEDDDDR